MDNNKNFDVMTVTTYTDDSPMYSHWSTRLSMYITKDGVTIKLNSDEIQQLMKAMPRTIGGVY